MEHIIKAKLFIVTFCLFFGIISRAQSVVLHFANGSNAIEESDTIKLSSLGGKEFNCDDIIYINGYTDNIGSISANKELSEKRANAVKDLLFTLLLKENNEDNMPALVLIAFGKLNPIAENNTKEGRGKNRRVEIIFSKKKCEDDGLAIDNLYKLIKDEPQAFCINPLKDTAIIGKEGTIVYYKAGTFINTGNCSCITLLLNEYLDNASFILNNLTTTSNGEPLESGGMTRLVGLCGRDTLQYQDGKFLIVMVPTESVLPDMKSFSANREKQSDYLNWELDKQYDEVIGLDWNGLSFGCGSSSGGRKSVKCHFFFCKIRKFLSGKGAENKYDNVTEIITKEAQAIQQFGMNKDQLGDALLISKDVNSNALKYYVYKNANWDYHNIDRYNNGSDFTNMYVKETPKPSKDVKLIYTRSKTVVPAFAKRRYEFYKVFDKNEVWIVGLKYKDEQSAYLSLKLENTKTNEVNLDFKEVNIAELKDVLKKLNNK